MRGWGHCGERVGVHGWIVRSDLSRLRDGREVGWMGIEGNEMLLMEDGMRVERRTETITVQHRILTRFLKAFQRCTMLKTNSYG